MSQPSMPMVLSQFDEPQDDFALALPGPAHRPHAIDHRRLDLDEALAPIALHRPNGEGSNADSSPEARSRDALTAGKSL
jgi:hypothetical protein